MINRPSSRVHRKTSSYEALQSPFDFRAIRDNVSSLCNTDNSADQDEPQVTIEYSQQDDWEQKRDDYVDDLDLD